MMRKQLWLAFTLLALLAACGGEGDEKKEVEMTAERRGEHAMLLHDIDSLKGLARADMRENPRQLNMALHREFIQKMEQFGRNYYNDTLAPYMMLKAARGYEEVLNEKVQAIDLYTVIYKDFPDFPDRPMMIFYQGSAYQDIMDTTLAVNRLNFFIKTYPDHEFADDAQSLIDFMRMDDEQMKGFFKEKKE